MEYFFIFFQIVKLLTIYTAKAILNTEKPNDSKKGGEIDLKSKLGEKGVQHEDFPGGHPS